MLYQYYLEDEKGKSLGRWTFQNSLSVGSIINDDDEKVKYQVINLDWGQFDERYATIKRI